MKGYFTRKPMNIEEVKAAIREGRRQGLEPVEIEPVGRIVLTLDEYIAFCVALLKDRDFLSPYADDAVFTGNGAKSVLVGAPGQHWVAVTCEGFNYPRYVAWPFTEEDAFLYDGE